MAQLYRLRPLPTVKEYPSGQSVIPAVYTPGRNCLSVSHASFASVIVDCGNYYRALHEAIGRARTSIFIVGWDIDSRIDMLRGALSTNGLPPRFFDLIKQKALQNTQLNIYLNRWDYSLYMAAEREGLSKLRWTYLTPPNVHYCLDNQHPFGACHHQKIVVIDDELAFVGGMDVALGRWDFREHHPRNKKRIDPGGTYQPHSQHAFGPHHDVMFMVAGPVVDDLAHIVRERWQMAKGMKPEPGRRVIHKDTLPKAWPQSVRPDFTAATVALSRTLPAFREREAIHEIEQLYLDEIAQAETFIYMENQYFTRTSIAEALHRRLEEKPQLRALLVSCDAPQGFFERKGMWSGRVGFHDVLMKDKVGDRVIMAYPVSREGGEEASIRIHSKVMIVDDKFLHIGSANLNNRSMRLDSECDLSLMAQNEVESATIATIRNDLIREHTGLASLTIERLIYEGGKCEKFLNYQSESRQHLTKINDETYRYQSFMNIARRIADADHPIFLKG